eukprot:17499_1
MPFTIHAVATQKAHQQKGRTCYANAVATAIRAAQKKSGEILDDHKLLVDDMTSKYGSDGAYTPNVLHQECAKHKLECAKVKEDEALNAIKYGKRVVVARFGLSQNDWKVFKHYFKNEKTGVLTKGMLKDSTKGSGHAVVIVGVNEMNSYWKIKNSWGSNFADCGHFRVAMNAINFEYWDVRPKPTSWWDDLDLIKYEQYCLRCNKKFWYVGGPDLFLYCFECSDKK